jgi:hypothetical protein
LCVLCSSNPKYADACGRVVDIIYQYPMVATRAGMLCGLLGACDSGSNCSSLQSPADSATKSALQLCSNDGTTATPAMTQLAVSAGQCTADANCAAGEVCDMETSSVTKCVCKDGLDTCYSFGTCKPLCQTSSYISSLAQLQAQYLTCSTSGANTCPPGMACAAAANCATWTCAAGDIVGASCPAGTGLCAVTAPAQAAAKFLNSKDTVEVTLDSYAAAASFPCSQAFDAATVAKLGAVAQCTAAGKQLMISLRGDSVLKVGDVLTLKPGQAQLVDAVSSTPFTGALPAPGVAKCAACTLPTAIVNHPTQVVKPCQASDPATIVLDASRSIDSSGRPLASVVWALPGAKTANLTAAFAAANAAGIVKIR